jgi:plastocyanin
MNSARRAALSLLPLFILACAPENQHPHDGGTLSTFSLSLSTSTLTVLPSQSDTVTVSVIRADYTTDDVTFSATGLPTGVTATFDPANTTGGTTTATFAAASNAAIGTHFVTIHGISGTEDETATLSLTITGPDFNLAVSPAAAFMFPATYTGKLSVPISRLNGFTGTVTLALEAVNSGDLTGLSGVFTPPTLSGATASSQLALTSSGAAPGRRRLRIRGVAGSIERTVDLDVRIAGTIGTSYLVSISDFSFSPAFLSIPVNATVSWENLGAFEHTATSDTGLFSRSIPSGQTSSAVSFTTIGDAPYHCNFHPSMQATISVVAEPPPP